MEAAFTPEIWPEQAAPPDAAECRNCELCSRRTRVIWGEGNPTAPVIIVLDNPGAREDRDGKAFVCGTRQTLQYAVFEAGLKMSDLFVTYILKCRPVSKYNKETARRTCISYLERQLETQKPRLAFCLGNTAVQWFFNDMTAEVKDLRNEWHNARNIPTLVSYHPLAVRRRPNLMRLFESDCKKLATRLRSTV